VVQVRSLLFRLHSPTRIFFPVHAAHVERAWHLVAFVGLFTWGGAASLALPV
jgi:hypothetical protein